MTATLELKELPQSTVRLLGSTQVITSVYSVVKELVENSLDAGSKCVDVKLENYGLDKIEIRDNGHGIPATHMSCVAKRYYTTKISNFSDLEHLESYGFRGEALGSLCSVSSLSITTRTKEDDISLTFTFNTQGEITGSKPSHLTQGTTITALNLFKNLPVRRQLYNNVKKKKEEIKKIETLLCSYGIICPSVRFILRHDKEVIWQKNTQSDVKSSLQCILGRNVFSQMDHKMKTRTDPKISVEAYLPKKDSDIQLTSRGSNDRCFVFVNSRPVQLKDVEKMVKQYYLSAQGCEGGRYPVCCLSIVLPSSELDVNVDPNKTRVFLHHQEAVMSDLKSMMEELYGVLDPVSQDKNRTKQDVTSSESSKNSSLPKCTNTTETDNCTSTETTMNQSMDDTFTKIISVGDSSLISNCLPVYRVATETNDFEISKSSNNFSRLLNSECDRFENNNRNIDRKKEFLSEKLETPDGCRRNKGETIIDEDDVLPELPASQKGKFDILEESLDEIEESLAAEETLLRSETRAEGGDSSSRVNISKSVNEDDEGTLDDSLADVLMQLKDSESPQDGRRNLENSQNHSGGKNCVMTDEVHVSTTNSHVRDELQWSKGQSVNTGQPNIQPVTLLNPGKRCRNSSTDLSPPAKRKPVNPDLEEDQPTLYDVISNTPRHRSSSAGYQAYSRHTRPSVVDDNPAADYEEVSKIIEQKWRNLSDQERLKYEGMSPRDKSAVSAKQELTPKIPKEKVVSITPIKHLKKKLKQSGLSIKDQLMAAAKKISNPEIPTKSVDFSMQKLRQTFACQLYNSQIPTATKMKLVGQVKSCGVWTCCYDNKLFLLNTHRIQETLLYRKLMSEHVLATKTLEQPIRVTPQTVGGEQAMETLAGLEREMSGDMQYYVKDSRLLSNGFRIRCCNTNEHINQDTDRQAEIVAMATYIPMYGVHDVAEILELILNTNAKILSESRPLKVLNYLQGEAVRMARQLPRQHSRTEIEDLLDQVETCIPRDCRTCLHNKPFYHPIYNMNDLPSTQSQSV